MTGSLPDIAGRYRGGTVVVSHDAVNREVLTAFDPGLGDPDALPQDNGCFNTLELREGRWTVLTVNEVSGHDSSAEEEFGR
jgi:broad specificity phosphatase PhoE